MAMSPTLRTLVLLLVGFAVAAAAAWGVGVLVHDVGGRGLLADVDRPILVWFAEHRSDLLTDVMTVVTEIGGTIFAVVALTTVAVVGRRLERGGRWPAFAGVCFLGVALLDRTAKFLVGRPRPRIDAVVTPDGSAFPSGHATAAAIACIALALLVRWGRGGGRWVWVAAGAGMLVVGVSRVYLGAHWPTDVAGGFALGGAWVAIAAATVKAGAETTPSEPE